MNGPAALLALALLQEPQAAPPAPAAQEGVASEPASPPEQPPAPRPAPPAEGSGPAAHEAPTAAPRPAPSAPPAPAATSAPSPRPAPAPTRAARPAPASTSTAPPPSTPTATPAPIAASPLPPSAGSVPPERAQVAAAAARFFRALLARRAEDLAALSSPGFSFDGRAARGAAEVRRRWFEAMARHDGVPYALYDLEVLPAAEASTRFGKPPRRIAALVQPGAWVAAANLSGRPTFVFFARQGGAWLATGMHD